MTEASSESPIGYQLLRDPRFNNGTAFTGSERRKFDLEGLLPAAIATIDLQIERRHALPQASDQIVDVLAAAGVKRVYGVVGNYLNGLTEAIRRQGKIEWVHMRNWEAGAFAAGAEAHLTDELAVCAGSCGPGKPAMSGRGDELIDLARTNLWR
jgi:hypothetical protein